MQRKIKGYGWHPDLPDHRDLNLKLGVIDAIKSLFLSAEVDLRADCPQIFNQGNLGSCTANAISAMDEFMQMKEKLAKIFRPSRLFIYYNERDMEGTVSQDSGAQIRDGIKSIAKQGVCQEALWPYDEAKFADKPSEACFTQGKEHVAISYMRVDQNVTAMKKCLVDGYPFVFGFTVYDSFESQAVANTGIVPMPTKDESVLGGHAVMAVGYSNTKKAFLIRNSWGKGWGIDGSGYCWMPFDYLTDENLSSDFWTLRVVK